MSEDFLSEKEVELLLKGVTQEDGLDDLMKPMSPRTHEEIGKLLFEREMQIRKEIDEAYARLHECQRCRDMLWKEG